MTSSTIAENEQETTVGEGRSAEADDDDANDSDDDLIVVATHTRMLRILISSPVWQLVLSAMLFSKHNAKPAEMEFQIF